MADDDFYSDLSHGALLKQMSLAELRTAIDAGTWETNDPTKHANAKEIIRRHEEASALAASSKRNAREEETLSISKSALSIAKDANRIASEDLAVARDNAKSARKSADAAERKRTDDAVFYFNLLREAFPSAIGQDALLDKMSGLGGSSQKEKSADQRTGTFYSVQVGVFADIKNARELAKQFEKYGHKVEIGSKNISDRKYHVVFIGRFDSYETAANFEKTIESERDDVYQVVAR